MALTDKITSAIFNSAVLKQYDKLSEKLARILLETQDLSLSWGRIATKMDLLSNNFDKLDAIVRAQHGLCMLSGEGFVHYERAEPNKLTGSSAVLEQKTPLGFFKTLNVGGAHTFSIRFPVRVTDIELTCSPNCVINSAVYQGNHLFPSSSSPQRIALPAFLPHAVLEVEVFRVY